MFTAEFVKTVAKKAGVSERVAKEVLNAETEVIKETLAEGDRVQIAGLGTFTVSQRDARMGRNPKSGESITIPAKKVPKFSASKTLKEAVEQ